MTLEQKINIVGKNYADEYLRKSRKAIETMIKYAYMEGFREGVRTMQETGYGKEKK